MNGQKNGNKAYVLIEENEADAMAVIAVLRKFLGSHVVIEHVTTPEQVIAFQAKHEDARVLHGAEEGQAFVYAVISRYLRQISKQVETIGTALGEHIQHVANLSDSMNPLTDAPSQVASLEARIKAMEETQPKATQELNDAVSKMSDMVDQHSKIFKRIGALLGAMATVFCIAAMWAIIKLVAASV